MSHRNRLVALCAVAVVAGAFLSLVGPSDGNVRAARAATPADGSAYEYIPVGNKGWTAVERKGDRSTVTWPMYSLATGEVIGTFTNDFKNKGPGTVDAVTSFVFADGKLVSHVQVSVVPDPARPGWILVGSRPDADSVVEATGVFAGRTGRVDMSGTNDLTKFATGELYQDAFWIIKLNK